jgi:hypothetical protein
MAGPPITVGYVTPVPLAMSPPALQPKARRGVRCMFRAKAAETDCPRVTHGRRSRNAAGDAQGPKVLIQRTKRLLGAGHSQQCSVQLLQCAACRLKVHLAGIVRRNGALRRRNWCRTFNDDVLQERRLACRVAAPTQLRQGGRPGIGGDVHGRTGTRRRQLAGRFAGIGSGERDQPVHLRRLVRCGWRSGIAEQGLRACSQASTLDDDRWSIARKDRCCSQPVTRRRSLGSIAVGGGDSAKPELRGQ